MREKIHRFKLAVIALLVFSLLLPSGLIVQPTGAKAAQLANLALGKKVSASTTSNAEKNGTGLAVDGDVSTSWNSNSKDLSPWFQVDFGEPATFNEVKLNWRSTNVKQISIQYMDSDGKWKDVFVKRPPYQAVDTIDFQSVTSSSVRLQMNFDSKNFQLYEFEVYNNPDAAPPSEHLSSVTLTDASPHLYKQDEVVPLAVNAEKSLILSGKLDNGSDAVLDGSTTYFTSSDPSVASVDNTGKIKALKDGKTKITAEAIVGGTLIGTSIQLEVYDPAQQINAVQGKPATASSGNAAAAVDGTNAAWIPSAADVGDDQASWLQTSLTDTYSFNRALLTFVNPEKLSGYAIQASSDGTVWKDVYAKTGTVAATESVIFPKTNGDFIRLKLSHLSEGAGVQEFEVYGSLLDILKTVQFYDGQQTYAQLNDTIYLNKGDTAQLKLKGTLTRGDEPADLSKATVTYTSKNTKVATIDGNAKITAVDEGVVLVYATAVLNEKTVYSSIWVEVANPNKDLKPLLADLELAHPSMTIDIGQPALLQIGDAYPSVTALPYVDAAISAELVLHDHETIQTLQSIPARQFQAGDSQSIPFAGAVSQYGQYEIRLTIDSAGNPSAYDTFYFTVLDPAMLKTDQSNIVYLGPDGRLVYVPDYKGNRVLDFSNVGYQGGGAALPDAPVKVVVEPVQGDATQLIQDAIDQVSAMPEDEGGIRGAVLLKKGRYDIAGSLSMPVGGVVLRGEGQDERDGTLLFGTGSEARTLIQAGSTAGVQVDSATAQDITDMFVPAGARSFRVADASGFKVKDTVIVRRVGNQSWIHATDMDKIYDRPGLPPGSSSQMTPFNLDFDREITKIEGNVITVDAPIANSIERRWGGGQIMKYSDPGRIENIGVENMAVDSDFDPSIMSTVMDNDTTDPYYADDNHLQTFVAMNGLKNSWVRDVTGKHLATSLVKIDRNAKWVTVQDCKVTDFVSTITGGTRYAYYFVGQLNLVQRSYSETERHAFVFDSRVPGPNVIHNSESQKNYNSSEPHHRWSTGGLFDQVKGHIVIRDRVWLGSGHTWAGANYVTWNTEGILTAQQPPTAQNYAIGHVGAKEPGIVPDDYDTRPRKDAYWDHLGSHVNPPSLYLQQLQDRLGEEAVKAIQPQPYGIGKPSAPAGLSAAAGDAQASLTWNTVSGATYYNVKRSTTQGMGYVNIASHVTDNHYTDTGLVNGTTYYYVVTAANSAGESAESNEASAVPSAGMTMQVPDAPAGLSAAAGDAQASLTWNTVSGATYYNVKRSTTQGTGYVNIAANVTDNHYTDTGLVNGTTYYYVVTAANSAGESAESNEASAVPSAGMTVQVPDAPAGLSAAAGDAQASLTWNTVSGATYYNVKRSTMQGTGYVNIAANVTSNVYKDLGLTNGAAYYYVVTAANDAGESAYSNEASAKPNRTIVRRSGGGGGSSAAAPIVQSGKDGAQFLNVDPVIEKMADGRTAAKVTLDEAAVTNAIEALIADASAAPQITIEATSGDADAAVFQLPAQVLADALGKLPQLVVCVKYGGTTYSLPIRAVDFAALAKQLGTEVKDVQLTLSMERVNNDTLQAVKDNAKQAGLEIVSEVVDFRVTAEAKGKSVSVTDFGTNYVSRTMSVGKTLDASRSTAVLYNPSTGKFSFVPAIFSTGGSGTQVTIKRPGNSIYAVAESGKSFPDLAGHWSRADVELLASKLVVNGMTDTTFSPDSRITRAEFAAILVRALGLSGSGASRFSDVTSSDWYSDVVGAAVKAGLIDGFEDGTFKPDANITREQMAVMAARALKLVSKPASGDAAALKAFADGPAIGGWAKEAVAQVLNARIMNGMTDRNFAPTDHATRAEAAVMVKRLLQYAELMN
ncbi:Endo-1,4-beta-xylanase A precursor [Paenibacillus konkukensis]|uniref:Endo-1,4-beta-xylanase A n=1 Tax=Paenibacillus konkukensis TaxID=2020716 RepID=A0ABY4RMD6_9BACL|nr:Endo-1,4-beta-xylanase A precursor [Paenibacillus konkukensis]